MNTETPTPDDSAPATAGSIGGTDGTPTSGFSLNGRSGSELSGSELPGSELHGSELHGSGLPGSELGGSGPPDSGLPAAFATTESAAASAASGGTAWPSIEPPGGPYSTAHLPAATDLATHGGWEMPAAPVYLGATRRDRIVVAAIVAVVVAALGFPLGWIWSSVAPWLPAQVDSGELIYADPEGEQRAGQEASFILLSLGLGVALALIAWLVLRRFRGSLMLAALTVGGAATGWIAWWYGHNIGRDHALNVARRAKNGAIVKLPPDLRIKSPGNVAHWHGIPYVGGDVLYVAVAVLVTYLLFVGFSASPALGWEKQPLEVPIRLGRYGMRRRVKPPRDAP